MGNNPCYTDDEKMEAGERFKKEAVIKTTIHVHYKYVEDLINAYFKNEGHDDDYNLHSEEEQYQSYMRIHVSGDEKDGVSVFTQKIIDRGEWPTHTLSEYLNTLCFLKVIEPGDYIIDVIW